jgi:hypothetical protein
LVDSYPLDDQPTSRPTTARLAAPVATIGEDVTQPGIDDDKRSYLFWLTGVLRPVVQRAMAIRSKRSKLAAMLRFTVQSIYRTKFAVRDLVL